MEEPRGGRQGPLEVLQPPHPHSQFGQTVKASLVAQMVRNLPAVQETQVRTLGWEDPLEKEWPPSPVFLPGKSNAQRSLAGYNP